MRGVVEEPVEAAAAAEAAAAVAGDAAELPSRGFTEKWRKTIESGLKDK